MINIVAVGDIHSPRYLQLFIKSMNDISVKPDLILLAGDLVEANHVHALKPVYDYLTSKYSDTPIISVFGNEEYKGFEYRYIEQYSRFKWLNDEYVVINVNNVKIGVIGTRGALTKPTNWQLRNIPGIVEYYRELPYKIGGMIDELRDKVDVIILLSHYGVTYRNLEGELKTIWQHLASQLFEKVIIEKKPDLVIHAHVHLGIHEVVYLDGVPVYNVSLPARGRVTTIVYEPSCRVKAYGLNKWLKTS